MINIILLLLLSCFGYCVFIGVIIFHIVKKNKGYIIVTVIAFCMLALLFIHDFPYYQDLAQQETTVIVAEYTKFQSSNTKPGTRMLFFKNEDGQEFSLYIPTITRAVAKMETGKTYEVEFFNNSKVIKEYILVNDMDQQ